MDTWASLGLGYISLKPYSQISLTKNHATLRISIYSKAHSAGFELASSSFPKQGFQTVQFVSDQPRQSAPGAQLPLGSLLIGNCPDQWVFTESWPALACQSPDDVRELRTFCELTQVSFPCTMIRFFRTDSLWQYIGGVICLLTPQPQD